MTSYKLRRRKIHSRGTVQSSLCVPEWAAESYLVGQRFTVEQLPSGALVYYAPVPVGLQPPAPPGYETPRRGPPR